MGPEAAEFYPRISRTRHPTSHLLYTSKNSLSLSTPNSIARTSEICRRITSSAMVGTAFYILASAGLALSLFITTSILCYILGVFPLLRELADNSKRRLERKRGAQPEEIELKYFPDVQRRARERRRAEEAKRREMNKARRNGGFYDDLARAYRRS